jgi:ATP-dependent RNA helicase RhlB
MDRAPLTELYFESLPLSETVTRALTQAGFLRLTPIQAAALPHALSGRDVAGQAQTGTGKTLAFLTAVFERLVARPALGERAPEQPRALILAPTRELAIQIHRDAELLNRALGFRLALCYGGVDYEKQRETLRAGSDVIVATPGRLIDYVRQKAVSLAAVEIAVIDEADRMFDLGFIRDLRFLLRKLPPRERRQCLLFSATLGHRVLELAYEHMNDPVMVSVDAERVPTERIRQQVFFPAAEEKTPLLLGLLARLGAERSIVFVNTRAAADKVGAALARAGHSVGVLSGDVPQKRRQTMLARFARGELAVLVATDVAARGLHIPAVSHVFNYDLPQDPEDYVHRIGRTARLGAEGDAISFACDLYAMSLPEIERYIGMSIPRAAVTEELLAAAPVSAPAAPREPRPRRRRAQRGRPASSSSIQTGS